MNESAIISNSAPAYFLFTVSLTVLVGGATALIQVMMSVFRDRADKKEKPSGLTKILKVGEKYSLEKILCYDINSTFYIVYRRYPFGIYKREIYSNLNLDKSEKEYKKLEAK